MDYSNGQPGKPMPGGNNVIDGSQPRVRRPVRFRWAQLSLRVLSLIFSLACFSAFIWLFVHYPARTDRSALAFSATVVAVLVDAFEVIRLIQWGYAGMSINPCASVFDIAIFPMAFMGWFNIAWSSGEGSSDSVGWSTRRAESAVVETVSMMALGLGAIHGFWSLLSCIGCCVAKCASRKEEKVVVVYVPTATKPPAGAAKTIEA